MSELSCIVTYRRQHHRERVCLQGFGRTLSTRVADADSRLPNGRWIRLSVSSPQTLLADLRGERNGEAAFFEGRTVFANAATRSNATAEEIL